MVLFATAAALFGILASVIAIASSAAALYYLYRVQPGASASPGCAQNGTGADEGAPGESPAEASARARREREARERFEDGMRAVLGYGNPVISKKGAQD